MSRLIKVALFLFFIPLWALSQTETVFSSREVVKLRIEGSWMELLKHRVEEPELAKKHRMQATVVVYTNDMQEIKIPAEVSLRGNTSLSPIECNFPKVKLHFNFNDTVGTIFEGYQKISIGSHCSTKGGNSIHYGRSYDGLSPVREALVYRLMNVLDIPSFKTREAKIQYVDPSLPQANNISWNAAFLLEDEENFAERMQVSEIKKSEAEYINLSGAVSYDQLAQIFYFEHMIENNDWHINLGTLKNWNVRLFRSDAERQILVVPYDYDLASFVTRLDMASATFDLLKVKLPESSLQNARNYFKSRRNEILAEIESIKSADANGYKHIKKKIELFYREKLK